VLNKANRYFARKAGIKPLAIEFFKDWSLNSTVAELVLQFGQPLKIKINLCRITDSQIIGLAHEYIHCQQIKRKKLEVYNGKYYWQGIDCSFVAYDNQKWEIEARELQFVWFKNFNSFLLTAKAKKFKV